MNGARSHRGTRNKNAVRGLKKVLLGVLQERHEVGERQAGVAAAGGGQLKGQFQQMGCQAGGSRVAWRRHQLWGEGRKAMACSGSGRVEAGNSTACVKSYDGRPA